MINNGMGIIQSSLFDLPSPMHGQVGWPWTVEIQPLPATMPDDSSWPRISIVTPSFNQGRFIEETIRSVLLQGYPNLEYIIIDGGSTDDSVDIIRQYEPWLTYWVSAKDRGQSHAINKGFEHATGELYGWINSDDYYLPRAFERMALFSRRNPDSSAWVGVCNVVNEVGEFCWPFPPKPGSGEDMNYWSQKAGFGQPACFFNAEYFRTLGGIDEHLHYILDVEFWMRLATKAPITPFPDVEIACYRDYPEVKTRHNVARREAETIAALIYHGAHQAAVDRIHFYFENYMPYPHLLSLFFRVSYRYARRRVKELIRPS